jgi:hypothetical protein
MEIHYKVTNWCKLNFDGDVKKEDIIKKLKKGCHPLDIGYDGIVPNLENCRWKVIEDTEEYLSPEENHNQATIELMIETKDGLLKEIWNNSIKK